MRDWWGPLKAAAQYAALSSGILLILAPSAMASGQEVIPYFLAAVAFTVAFTYVVYRVAVKYARRPGIAALTYFVSVLAILYLSMSVFAVNETMGSVEGFVLSLLPDLEPMSFARNVIGAGLVALEAVIPASGIAAIVALLTGKAAN